MEAGSSDQIYGALQRIIAEKRGGALVPEAPPLFSSRLHNLRPLEERLNEFVARPWVDLSDVPLHARNPLVLFFKRMVLKSTYWLFHPLFNRISHNSALLAQFCRFTLDELRQLSADVDHLNKQIQLLESRGPLGPGHVHLGVLRNALKETGGEVIEITSGHGALAELLTRSGISARAISPAALGAVGDETLGALAVVSDVETMRGDLLWLLVQTALTKLRPGATILFESAVGGTVRPSALAHLLETSGFREVETSDENGRHVVRAKR